jgi:hypothetical protein
VKKPKEKTWTLAELETLAEKFNNEPWTYPSDSQKRWLGYFVKSLKTEEKE